MKALSAPTIAALAASLALATLRGPSPAAQEGGQEGRPDPAPAGQQEGGDSDAPRRRGLPRGGPERPGDGARYDVFGRRIGGEPETFAERFLGGWQLVEMVVPGITDQGREAQGFLHVSPGFLSMEIHAAWGNAAEDGAGAIEEDFHESFTAEYQILGGNVLRCETILGSYLDDEVGALMWEVAGYERRFRIQEVAGRVVLEFGAAEGEQGRLVWERRMPTLDAGLDVFGRRRGVDDIKGGQDVFGRDVEPGVGEPDIFGRKGERPEKGAGAGEDPEKKTEGGEPEPAPSGGGGQ